MATPKRKPVRTLNKIFLHVSADLTSEQRKNLIFYTNIPKFEAEKCLEDFTYFWTYMMKQSEKYRYHEDDLSELFEDLEEIGEEQLAKEAKEMYEAFLEYKAKMHTPEGQSSPPSNFQAQPQGMQASPSPGKQPEVGASPSTASTAKCPAVLPQFGDQEKSPPQTQIASCNGQSVLAPSGQTQDHQNLISIPSPLRSKEPGSDVAPQSMHHSVLPPHSAEGSGAGNEGSVSESRLLISKSRPVETTPTQQLSAQISVSAPSNQTLPLQVQPSSTLEQTMNAMKSMSLSDMELLLGTDERDKVPRSTLHQETEIDAENQNHPISGLTPDVVKDSASLELSKSSAVELDSELLHGGHTSKLQFLTPTKEVSARFGEDLVGSRLGTDTTKDSESPGQAESFANREEIISKPKVELNFNATAKESTKTTLRGYQNELAEPGIKGASYIICAPTGSGKTITVANICYKRMLKMKREGHEEDFKAIFIVPTRHLKKQQREAFQELFAPGTVAALAPGEQFSSVFNRGNVRVLMITAQVLVNALIQGQFRLSNASMIVFDECHHTTLNHPYNEIMRQYLKDKKELLAEKVAAGKWQVGLPQKGLPQVIGLTASIGTGTSDDAHGHIVTLCANLDCLGVKDVEKPENIEELKEKNKPPEADKIVATPKKDETDISRRFVQLLKETMEDIEKHLLSKYLSMDIGNDQMSPKGTQDYECWIATIRSETEGHNEDLYACAAYLFHLNLALMVYEDLRATDALQAVETFKLSTRSSIDVTTTGRNCRLIYEKNLPELRELAERDDPLGNPKLLYLQELVKHVFQKEPKSKAIILARTRFATLALLEFIKESQDLQGIVRPVRIVGQSKEVDAGQTEAKQEAALDRFRDDNEDHPDRANLLVATDIVQEGLNIPACNAIIRYNFVSNEIGTVQSKGRARADKSMCFLIVESGSLNQRREYQNRERIVKMDEAIKQAKEMDPREWRRQLAQRQLTIIQHVEEKEAKTQAHKSSHSASNVKVLCNQKDCKAFVCHAKDIERRLSNYTCLDGTISERTRIRRFSIPREFRESRTVGTVNCGKCGNQLGQAIEFLRGGVYKPGHNLLLKSLLFQYQLDDGSLEEKTFNKWKKVDFEIVSEQ